MLFCCKEISMGSTFIQLFGWKNRWRIFQKNGWRVRVDFPVENIGGIIPSNDLELKVLILICWFWKIGRSMAWHVHNVHKNTREASNYLGGSSKPIFIFTPILGEMIQIDKCFSIGWLNHQIARDHQPLPMMSQEWWGVYATEAGTNPQAWCLWRMQVTIHPRNWTTRYPSGNGKIFPPQGTFEDDFIEMFLFQWRDMLVIFGGYPKIGHLWSQNLSPPPAHDFGYPVLHF